jgi:O-antigen ligase
VAEVRVTGPEGENYNTLSGYLVVCIAAGIAAIPAFPRGKTKIFLILCTVTAAAAVLLSFSREGYVMLFGSLLVFGFTRHRKIVFGAFVALILVFFLAAPVRENVHNTMGQIRNSQNDDPGSNSLTARFRSWDYRWNGWFLKQPLLGCGVGSVALSVDSEYVLRACEVGILGFSVFLWWLASIGQQVRKLQRNRGFAQMISVGLGAAFVGLLIQGSVAASFNSIRTMEPFWFFLGLVTAAVAIQRQKALQEAK